MIMLEDVHKSFGRSRKRRVVLDAATVEFMSGVSHGVLARPGQGKTTLIQILCGTLMPDHGRIERNGGISYPLGYAGWLSNELTGVENIAFVARLYGKKIDDFVEEVFDFTEMSLSKDRPLREMTPVQRSKICYGVSLSLGFDTLLIDEAIGAGDAAFRAKCFDRILNARERGGIIATSSNWTILARFCEIGCVLHQGRLELFGSMMEARKYLDWLSPE